MTSSYGCIWKHTGTNRNFLYFIQAFILEDLEVCELNELESKVFEAVGKVVDPETGLTFAEMQMIKSVKEEEPGVVKIEFIPSSPFCPIAFKLAVDIKREALKVAGVKKALVYCRGHMMEKQINEATNKE